MIRLFCRRGQSTLEYAILIAVIAGGLIAMQTYVKRGMQGRLRGAADDIGEQYSPGKVESKYTTYSKSAVEETVLDGVTTSTILDQDKTTRSGYERLESLDTEKWPN